MGRKLVIRQPGEEFESELLGFDAKIVCRAITVADMERIMTKFGKPGALADSIRTCVVRIESTDLDEKGKPSSSIDGRDVDGIAASGLLSVVARHIAVEYLMVGLVEGIQIVDEATLGN